MNQYCSQTIINRDPLAIQNIAKVFCIPRKALAGEVILVLSTSYHPKDTYFPDCKYYPVHEWEETILICVYTLLSSWPPSAMFGCTHGCMCIAHLHVYKG